MDELISARNTIRFVKEAFSHSPPGLRQKGNYSLFRNHEKHISKTEFAGFLQKINFNRTTIVYKLIA